MERVKWKIIPHPFLLFRNVEPRSDSLKFKVYERNISSEIITLNVKIRPVNDEAPVVKHPSTINVAEGRYMILNNLAVVDADFPTDVLSVTVGRKPTFGDIVHVSNSSPLQRVLYGHFKWSAAYR